MRTVLNGLCWFTAAASAWLGVMFVVLQHPGYERGLGLAVLFVLQSLLTLAVITGWLTGAWGRFLAVTGAAAIIWAGGAAITTTLNGPHFEGYALVIGVVLVAQGLLTAGQLIRTYRGPSSKVHQFGN